MKQNLSQLDVVETKLNVSFLKLNYKTNPTYVNFCTHFNEIPFIQLLLLLLLLLCRRTVYMNIFSQKFFFQVFAKQNFNCFDTKLRSLNSHTLLKWDNHHRGDHRNCQKSTTCHICFVLFSNCRCLPFFHVFCVFFSIRCSRTILQIASVWSVCKFFFSLSLANLSLAFVHTQREIRSQIVWIGSITW